MAAYLIAEKDSRDLVTTVFSSEGGDAVAVFSDPNNAQRYIEEAGWQDQMTVATVDDVQLMEWLIQCYRNGVTIMATDPVRSEQEAKLKLDVLNIEAQLQRAGRQIMLVANRDF